MYVDIQFEKDTRGIFINVRLSSSFQGWSFTACWTNLNLSSDPFLFPPLFLLGLDQSELPTRLLPRVRTIMAEPDYMDGDCDELIKPKKLVNPVKSSRNHQDLHRELLMNQKRWTCRHLPSSVFYNSFFVLFFCKSVFSLIPYLPLIYHFLLALHHCYRQSDIVKRITWAAVYWAVSLVMFTLCNITLLWPPLKPTVLWVLWEMISEDVIVVRPNTKAQMYSFLYYFLIAASP